MRVLCRHGHYAFFPRDKSDLGNFTSIFGVSLKPEKDFFTFPLLVGAPNYSLSVMPWLNLVAVKTFEGEPWEVMKANGFVYNVSLGIIVPKEMVLSTCRPALVGSYFLLETLLLQSGSRNLAFGFQQILSYDAELDSGYHRLLLRSFSYE